MSAKRPASDATSAGGTGGTGGGSGTTGFAGGGAGTLNGFLGLLQRTQQIRNSEQSLEAQLRTLELLEAALDAGLIDIAQVDQFRQSIETERATLLQAQNSYLDSLETFLTGTLGLPPDLPVELDDDLLDAFRFVGDDMLALQNSLADLISDFGNLPAEPPAANCKRCSTKSTNSSASSNSKCRSWGPI